MIMILARFIRRLGATAAPLTTPRREFLMPRVYYVEKRRDATPHTTVAGAGLGQNIWGASPYSSLPLLFPFPPLALPPLPRLSS